MPQMSSLARSPRKFWLGPGLLLAASASILIWRFVPRDGTRAVVEHVAIPAAATTLSAPEPQWVLSRRSWLELNPSQVSRLQTRASEWERNTSALRDELQLASENFSSERSKNDRSGSSIEQIQERTSRVSELTHQLLVARSAWWVGASTILTVNQRRRAEQDWSHRFIVGRSRSK